MNQGAKNQRKQDEKTTRQEKNSKQNNRNKSILVEEMESIECLVSRRKENTFVKT